MQSFAGQIVALGKYNYVYVVSDSHEINFIRGIGYGIYTGIYIYDQNFMIF